MIEFTLILSLYALAVFVSLMLFWGANQSSDNDLQEQADYLDAWVAEHGEKYDRYAEIALFIACIFAAVVVMIS